MLVLGSFAIYDVHLTGEDRQALLGHKKVSITSHYSAGQLGTDRGNYQDFGYRLTLAALRRMSG